MRAVVSEGATTRSVGELRSVPGSTWGPVLFNAVMTAGTAVFSDATPPEHLIDQVGRIAPRSMFLIYAPRVDGGEERRFNTAFFRAAGEPKQIGGSPRPGTSAPRRLARRSTSDA